MEKPTAQELHGRITAEAAHFGGVIPERVAIAWGGYIAALLEWDLLSVADHARLCDLLPKVPDDPVVAIFLGRHGTDPDVDPNHRN